MLKTLVRNFVNPSTTTKLIFLAWHSNQFIQLSSALSLPLDNHPPGGNHTADWTIERALFWTEIVSSTVHNLYGVVQLLAMTTFFRACCSLRTKTDEQIRQDLAQRLLKHAEDMAKKQLHKTPETKETWTSCCLKLLPTSFFGKKSSGAEAVVGFPTNVDYANSQYTDQISSNEISSSCGFSKV